MADLEAFEGFDRARPLDASGAEPGYLITGPSGVPIRLSASAYHLVRAAREGAEWAVLARQLSQHRGRVIGAGDLESAYRRAVVRIEALETAAQTRRSPPGFWGRRPLLTGDTVAAIARRLALAFAPRPALATMVLLAATFAHALGQGLAPAFSRPVFWPAYLLFTLSLIAHELGHASACSRFGARPADVGFTFYWLFPAFYSDVTAAWQLRRRQRVIVDLGGVYFQLVFGAGYWLLFLLTGWQPLETAVWMILCGCLFSLNPFFKLDGYWLLADALGVPHLSRQPRRLWRRLGDRWRGEPTPAWPWPGWVTASLVLYTPLVVAFWATFLARLVPALGERLVSYPGLLGQLVGQLAAAEPPTLDSLSQLAVSTFFLVVSGVMLRQLALRWTGSSRQPDAKLQAS